MRLIELRCIIVFVYDRMIVILIVILIVDCGSWIACKIKDSCERSTLVCYISVSICKIAPKHLVNRVLERHCLESYELHFWSPDALHKIFVHNFIEGIFDEIRVITLF